MTKPVKYVLVYVGLLAVAAVGAVIYLQATEGKATGELSASQSCAVTSAGKGSMDEHSITCRNAYRKGEVDLLFAKMSDATGYNTVDGPQKSSLSANDFPFTVFFNPLLNHKDYNYDVPGVYFNFGNTTMQQGINICQPVIQPVSVNGSNTCNYKFALSGTFSSTPTTTAYFYIPFHSSGVYPTPHQTGLFQNPDTVTSFVLGACLENGTIYFDQTNHESHPLIKQTGRSSITVSGSSQYGINCT